MAFVTSPVFVFVMMTSWIWLIAAGIIYRNNYVVSKILFSYAFLFFALNFLVYLSSDAPTAWAVVFASPALVWIPASIASLVLCFHWFDSDTDLFHFLLFFACITFLSYIVFLIFIYFLISLVSMFQAIAVYPPLP